MPAATASQLGASTDYPDGASAALRGSQLLAALRRLDRRLQQAVALFQSRYGAEVDGDAWRDLYITDAGLHRLWAQEPGTPGFWQEAESAVPVAAVPRLAWLQEHYQLTDFDLHVLLIALAPELDLRYERLFAYLQDDITRKRPTVNLVLNLLCATAVDKLVRRAHFAADAPLFRHRLLYLFPDPNQSQPPLLAHYLRPDEQLIPLLLGQGEMDSRLAGFCELSDLEQAPSSSLSDLAFKIVV